MKHLYQAFLGAAAQKGIHMKTLSLEIEVEGQHTTVLQVEATIEAVRRAVRNLIGGVDVALFEKDKDAELTSVEGRSAIAVVAHRCTKVMVSVGFSNEIKETHFSPSATVFRVLAWATGKRGFNLDDDAKAKATLILPGSEEPLPRDDIVGKHLIAGTCNFRADLTLKDFTNGER